MRVQNLTPADADTCAEIHSACFEDAAWSHGQLAGSLALDNVRGWLALDAQGHVAGFALCQRSGDDLEILTIGVLPHQQKTGIGSALLRHIIAAAKSAADAKIFLEVAQDNTAALALYRKAGFQQIGQRPGYYARKTGAIDALLLALEI